jgi:TP901 family phage tail tape measure protein
VRLSTDGLQQDVANAQRIMESGFAGINRQLQSFGGSLQSIGAGLTVATLPIAGVLQQSASAFATFNENMVNVQAVTQASAEQMAEWEAVIRQVGASSRFGGAEASAAFYDIVGGVTDATQRVAIFEEAIALAEAGNADLAASTRALISVMNSYASSGLEAGRASDILTRAVGMGVGTMDQFAAALPQITGLANSLGISFEDVGAAAAFLTTQGNTASEATTQLAGMMSALMNPNQRMRDALERLGYTSGQAAIEALGLVGAYQALAEQEGAEAIPALVGQLEAMRGVTALTGGQFAEFQQQFEQGIDGLTDSTRLTQMQSVNYQFALLQSGIQDIGITIGSVMLPPLTALTGRLLPLVQQIGIWAQQNPAITSQIVGLAGALVALGPTLGLVGTLIRGVGTALTIATGPMGLIIAGVGALYWAFQTNFLGIRDAVQPVLDLFGELATAFQTGFSTGGIEGGIDTLFTTLTTRVPELTPIIANLQSAFSGVGDFINASVLPALQQLGAWFISDALPQIAGIAQTAFGTISSAIAWVMPYLLQVGNWFLVDGLPMIQNFISGTVLPVLAVFANTIAGLWTWAQPGLTQLADWFTTSALPGITTFINDEAVPFFQDLGTEIGNLWTDAQPHLDNLRNWFTTEALPGIIGFVNETVIPAVQGFIDALEGIGLVAQPLLEIFNTWWTETFMPGVQGSASEARRIWDGFVGALSGMWATVQPLVQPIYDWFRDTFSSITTFIQPVIDFVVRIATEASNTLNMLRQLGSMVGIQVPNIPAPAPVPAPIAPSGSISTNQYGGFGAALPPPRRPITMRDSGGFGYAGQEYVIGSGAQPERFVPQTNGMFVPNSGAGITINGLVINADTAEGGRAAADAFSEHLQARMRGNGLR